MQLLCAIVLVILLLLIHIALGDYHEPLSKLRHLELKLIGVLELLYHDLVAVIEDPYETRVLGTEVGSCNNEIIPDETHIALPIVLD